jgi:hypothetical protein
MGVGVESLSALRPNAHAGAVRLTIRYGSETQEPMAAAFIAPSPPGLRIV